jgi:hypothetical protein
LKYLTLGLATNPLFGGEDGRRPFLACLPRPIFFATLRKPIRFLRFLVARIPLDDDAKNRANFCSDFV